VLLPQRPPNCQGHSAMIGPRASAPPASQHPTDRWGQTWQTSMSASGRNGAFHSTSPPQLTTMSHPGHDPKHCPNHCVGDVQLWSYTDCVSLCMTVSSIEYHIYHTLGSAHLWFSSLGVRAHTDTFPHVTRTWTQLPCLTPADPQLRQPGSISSLSRIETQTMGRDNSCW
jgi:hypothetical protein